MNNYYFRVSILLILVLIEVLSSTFWMDTMPIQSCRWMFLWSGLSISFYLMILPLAQPKINSSNSLTWIPILLLIPLFLWIIPSFNIIFNTYALDYVQADMLPVIQVMYNRWLHHQAVYDMIPDFWNGTIPVYLPAMWMPFIPAGIFSFDPRWITIGLMVIGIGCIVLRKYSAPMSLFFFLFIGLWFDYLIHNRIETFRLSQEGVVYFYLIALVLSIYAEQAILIGVTIALCLLSRYSIVFFIIGIFICFYFYKDKKFAGRVVFTTIFTGILLMILSGAWRNLTIFIDLPNQYLSSIYKYPSKYQSVLDEGLGVVPFVGINNVSLVLKIVAPLLILTAMGMITFYKRHVHRFYLLGFLKLTLVVFYNLMIIPYQYLMYSSVVVSMTLYYLYANHDEKQMPKLVV